MPDFPEGPGFLKAPVKPEVLEPVSELIAVKPSLWEKLLAREGVENPAIELGRE